MPENLVTAVIPTRGRPALVKRAIQSALAQTYTDIEVVVVVDGEDALTSESLKRIRDRRVHVVQLAEPVGGSDARNIGVLNASGKWIAFLDDDDEWLRTKIERQMAAALKCEQTGYVPVVTCQLFARRANFENIWPRREPSAPISEYLFNRKSSWSYGEGLLQTSTLMTTLSLMRQVPFTSKLLKHQDLDWILRATAERGVQLAFVPEALAVWNLAEHRSSVSTDVNWSFSLDWIRAHDSLVTPRAYAGFIATEVAHQAASQKAWRAFVPLLREMLLFGRPNARDLAIYFGMWLPRIFRNLAASLTAESSGPQI